MTVSNPRFILKTILLTVIFITLCLLFSGCVFLSSSGQDGTAAVSSEKGPKIVLECEVTVPMPQAPAAPGMAPARAVPLGLDASTRQSLLNLQATTALTEKTRERLATGQKVNTALNDAIAFFQAKSLDNRASDLTSLKDSFTQNGGIQGSNIQATGKAEILLQMANNLKPEERNCLLVLRDKDTGNLLGAADIGKLPDAGQLGSDKKESNSGSSGGDSPFSNSGNKGPVLNMDLNQEGANLVSLQPRQQLGVMPTFIANQSQQSLLSLFRAPAFNTTGPLWSLGPDAAQSPLQQTASSSFVIATNLQQDMSRSGSNVFYFYKQAGSNITAIFIIKQVGAGSQITNNSDAELIIRAITGDGTLTISGSGTTTIEKIEGTLTVKNNGTGKVTAGGQNVGSGQSVTQDNNTTKTIKITGIKINSTTTAQALLNIDNNICNDINLLNIPAVQNLINSSSDSVIVISANSNLCNTQAISNVISSAAGSSNVESLAQIFETVARSLLSENVTEETKKLIAGSSSSSGNSQSATSNIIDSFVTSVSTPEVTNNVSNIQQSVNLGGTVINSRTSPNASKNLAALITPAPNTKVPQLTAVSVSPAKAYTGDVVTLAFTSDVPLASLPDVTIFGRKAEVTKISDTSGVARITIAAADATFNFSINNIVGINGKTANAVSTTTDGSNVTILQNAQAVLTPVATPPAGTYTAAQTVKLETGTANAVIRYTTDGGEPSETSGNVYTTPINVTASSAIKAVAIFNGASSSTMAAAYIIAPPKATAAPPILSMLGGSYTGGFDLTIRCPGAPEAKIKYAIVAGASNGDYKFQDYTAPINLTAAMGSVVVKAYATIEGMNDSRINTFLYEFTKQDLQAVAEPVISPAAGKYDRPQTVTITCATPDSSIRYTLDDSLPSFSNGTAYVTPFIISKPATVKAIAFKTGMADSKVVSASIDAAAGTEAVTIAEAEPKKDQTTVNSNFKLNITAPSGTRLAAELSGANVLRGVESVVSAGGAAELPVDILKLAEGKANAIKVSGIASDQTPASPITVTVTKDTVPPVLRKLSTKSTNPSDASIAAAGDTVVISLQASEPLKNITATVMTKSAFINKIDDLNWTVTRKLDGTEGGTAFDFLVKLTDLAENDSQYLYNKDDINEGAPLKLSNTSIFPAFTVTMSEFSYYHLIMSAIPSTMDYAFCSEPYWDGRNDNYVYKSSGNDQPIAIAQGFPYLSNNYLHVRDKKTAETRNLGRINVNFFEKSDYIDPALKTRYAFDVLTGKFTFSAVSYNGKTIPASNLTVHFYWDRYKNPIMFLGDASVENSDIEGVYSSSIPSWPGPVGPKNRLYFFISSNGGTPLDTSDDLYGMGIHWSSVFSTLNKLDGGYVFDGRSGSLLSKSSFYSFALLKNNETVPTKLSVTETNGGISKYKLPFAAAAGDRLKVSSKYPNASIINLPIEITVAAAPRNLAEGFGNFNANAAAGEITITSVETARDKYVAFISADNGATWAEAGALSSTASKTFKTAISPSSKIKVSLRDLAGNYSLILPEGVSPAPAPVNAASGDRAFIVLGHEGKIEIDNTSGKLTGFKFLYSLDGGAWNYTEAISASNGPKLPSTGFFAATSASGRQKLPLPGISTASKLKLAIWDPSTGNVSMASEEYALKTAANRSQNAIVGDFTVSVNEKKVYVNNAGAALDGYTVFINGAEAGKISSSSQSFSYVSGASGGVSVYYKDLKGNTWLAAYAKSVAVPGNGNIKDGDFFVNAAEGGITFKNSGGAATGLIPLVSSDGGNSCKALTALAAGDNKFSLAVKAGDAVTAAFKDAEGNIGAFLQPYKAVAPALATPVKMLQAGDGGPGAKAGVIIEAGKTAVKLRPGITLASGESLKITLLNGGSATMTAKASIDSVIPVFGEPKAGIVFEAGAAGNGDAANGSFNLTNPGGAQVLITGVIKISAALTDARGNVSPLAETELVSDQTPPIWETGYPSAAATEYYKLKISLRANKDGKIYLVCLKSSEAAPTSAQVKNGTNAAGVAITAGLKAVLDFTAASGPLEHVFSGLENNAEYAIYAVAEDLYENLQAQPAATKVKTLDNPAPAWASGYPRTEEPEFYKLKLGVMMNETGSIYILCLKSSLAAPTSAQVKAGTDASGTAVDPSLKAALAMDRADSEAVYIFSALESSTEYSIYAVAEDVYGQMQAAPALIKARTKDPNPPAWATGYPSVQPSYYSARVSLNADKTASVYLVCAPANVTSLTKEQIKAGTDASGAPFANNLKGTIVLSPGVQGNFEFNMLRMATAYNIFAVAENLDQIMQDTPFTQRITTQYLYIDSAPPTLYNNSTSKQSIYPLDVDSNSKIDHVVVRFNESVVAPDIVNGDVTVVDGSAFTVNSVKTDADGIVATREADGDGSAGQYLVIRVSERGAADSSTIASITIAANKVKDTAGNWFAGILTSSTPAWIASYPQSTDINASEISMLLKSTGAGKAYGVCILCPDPAAPPSPPTAAQVKVGKKSDGIDDADSFQTQNLTAEFDFGDSLTFSGLTENKTYDLYIIFEDADGKIYAPVKFTESTPISE